MSKHAFGRVLLAAALLTFLWAVVLYVTGGFVWETAVFRVASRDPFRPAIAGVALLLVSWYLEPRASDQLFASLEDVARRYGALAALLLAGVVFAAGLRFGTYAASGADAYGYVSQADRWLSGTLRVDQRSLDFPRPFDDWALSPLGYHPGPTPHVLVPTYPSGLPMLMAAAKKVAGANGAFYLVPLFGGIAVFVTYCLGTVLYDQLTGVCAAALFAASPVFLFQLMWPMSDVPATAAWTLALLFALLERSVAAGVASGAATLIRPNLAPLILPVAIAAARPADWSRGARPAALRVMRVAAGALPGAAAVALLNAYLYGGPLTPSYTHLDSLFRWNHFLPNIARYIPWLVETETPFILAAILPLVSARFTLPGTAGAKGSIRAAAALFIAVTLLSYVFYQPYDDWPFLRFLLPMFPLALVLAVGAVRSLAPLVGGTVQMAALAAVTLSVCAWELTTAQARGVPDARRTEQRYVVVGHDVAASTPDNAVYLSMQQSGSLRYYTGRLTVRYDSLPEGSLDEALRTLQARGYHPYFVLEDWEERAFRERFAASSVAGRLDWRPLKRWTSSTTVRLYDPGDRGK